MFDDSWNLRGLERIARNPTLIEATHYVLNGIASELGRPLTMATFALQYASWPWHPSDFTRLNIMLHLLNGALLYWALLRILRLSRVDADAGELIALGSAVLWLLAPLQASAVLYIIQRMAVLSGTFVILGMLLYALGRSALDRGHRTRGLFTMSAAVIVGAGIGTLAKENAALLPLGLLALEFTLFAHLERGNAWRRWAAVFLVAPSALLLFYLFLHLPGHLRGFDERSFTVGERLLTEARILFLYLYKLFVPSLYSIRLLYDDVTVSRSLLSPLTTLASVAAWAVLVVLACRFRRQAAPAAFAVLWFLANHLLESTFLPLELAFEHRNYVAAIGPVLALVWYLVILSRSASAQRLRRVLGFAAFAYLAFHVAALWSSAVLWGNTLDLARYWARTQPNSIRAQLQLADAFFWYANPRSAVATLEAAMDRWPGEPTLPIAIMGIGCYNPDAAVPGPDRIRRSVEEFDGQAMSTLNMLDRLITDMEQGICSRYSADDIRFIVEQVGARPEFSSQERNLLLLRSRLAEIEGDRAAAMDHLDRAIGISPALPLLTQGVVWALEAGDIERARRYVLLAERAQPRNPLKRWSSRLGAAELREVVETYAGAPLESAPSPGG